MWIEVWIGRRRRRRSRERRARATVDRAVAAGPDGLRAIGTTEGLRGRYLADDGGRTRAAVAALLPAGARGEAMRLAEDAACYTAAGAVL